MPRHRQGLGVRPGQCETLEGRPARRRQTLAAPSRLYGVHICLTLGLPEEVAHCAAAHSGEGELVLRSLENTILHQADYTFWRVADAGGQLADTDPWLDGELSATSGTRI